MTRTQWDKTIERAAGILAERGEPSDTEAMLNEIRQLVRPIDETKLDTDNTAKADADKTRQIADMEASLKELKKKP